MRKRIGWLDVVKCFGIFAIFWGHYGVDGGNAGQFVFTYHVPLFFLVSGCSEYLSRGTRIRSCLSKVFRDLLIPWLFFCIASIVIHVLQTDCELLSLWPMVWKILQGTIRNTFTAWGLWFLTCLASIKVIFAFLRKLRSPWLILGACVILHVVTWFTVDPEAPVLPFNLDAALYYLLYYGIGFVSFPAIDRLLNTEHKGGKLLLGLSFCVSAGYCAYLYFGRNLFGFLEAIPFGQKLLPVLTALTAIWFNIVLAYIFRDVESFQKIGRNTLYLCGSEYPVRIFSGVFMSAIGLNLTFSSSLASCFASIITLWWANKYLVPIEKRILSEILSAVDFFTKTPAIAGK